MSGKVETTSTLSLPGSRIVDVQHLNQSVQEVSDHAANCGGQCVITKEVRAGLATRFTITCNKCHRVFTLNTSDKTTTPNGDRWLVNVMAVLGTMSTGGGSAQLTTVLSTMGIPSMSKGTFVTTERLLGDFLKNELTVKMMEAGEQEREMAIARNDFHQGVPAITVIADGGWSKRCHKHSYNAKSGVAVIFGQQTKKLLFLSVRNKFCSICTIAENRKTVPPQHRCYRNWSHSSTAMEADIICEGFAQSEIQHGVRYLRLIGDGDSSVLANITTSTPYGVYVQKLECANHACKGYRSRLEKLSKDHPEFQGRGGLTKRVIQRLAVGARVAIRKHSKTGNVQQLRHDLRNGPNHVFGDHRKCNPAFCAHSTTIPNPDPNDSETAFESGSDGEDCSSSDCNSSEQTVCDQLDVILSEELDEIPTASDEHEARRGAYQEIPPSIHPALFSKVQLCADRLVSLSAELIANETSNLAECYMSIRSNFDGGKYFNRIQSGSFEARCYAAGLRFQDGPSWALKVANQFSGSSSNEVLETATKRKAQSLEGDQKRKQEDEYKKMRSKSRYTSSSSTDHHYGPNSQQRDASAAELDLLCQEYYANHVLVSGTAAEDIKKMTVDQASSQIWFSQRHIRLTASNFGRVSKRRATTPIANLVKSLLYTRQMDVPSLRWGKTHEEDARKAYISHMKSKGHSISIQQCGLFIDTSTPCLACSPDGIVSIDGEKGLLEIKCPYKAAKEGLTPVQAASTLKNFFCKISPNDPQIVELKRSHNYFYQVQGQLGITQLPWCDFFIWTPAGSFVERIRPNQVFWSDIKPKLTQFYHHGLLPELALPRYPQGLSIREPFLN